MFRASPWISYEPQHQLPFQQQLELHPQNSSDTLAQDTTHSGIEFARPSQITDPYAHMDAPEISTLREEEEETPPPDAGRLSFSKFRVNLRMPARGQTSATSPGSTIGPPIGPPPVNRRAPSPPDSDDEEEEDQLIDDDELAIVTETGHLPVDAPTGLVAMGSPGGSSTPSPRKRGGPTRGRQRRGGVTGRRGRPGREPPDAAAMMSTFELAKTDQATGPSAPPHASPPAALPAPPPQIPGPPAGDWSSTAPPKPPRKKPGPKKGTTAGPRGPRKNAKNSQLTSGRGTPVDDSLLSADPSSFLVPAPPSIPPTPGSDQPPLPQHLPPINVPDLTLDPNIPVPIYPLPTRSFPVQAPPKVPAGYATTHPLDPHSGPPRKWKLAQREIKGIAGGRWLARCWVGEKEREKEKPPLQQPAVHHVSLIPPSPPHARPAPLVQEPMPPLRPSTSGPDSVQMRAAEPSPHVATAPIDEKIVRPSDHTQPPLLGLPRDTSPESESPRSPAATNATPEPTVVNQIS